MQRVYAIPARPPATGPKSLDEPNTGVLTVPRPAAAGTPENGLENHILGPIFRYLETEPPKVVANNLL